MKKLITYSLAVIVAAGSFAQVPVKQKAAVKATLPNQASKTIDLEQKGFYQIIPGNTALKPTVRSGRSGETYIPIGSSYNFFNVLLDEPNQVSYNKDVNSVTYFHRQNNLTPGGSGGLSFDVSTDGGATWTTNQVITPAYDAGTETPATVVGNRYPSGAIWNPPGNTNPDFAFEVGNGPTLYDSAPSGAVQDWGYQFRVSATLDGNNISEEYYQSPGHPQDFHPYGLQAYGSGYLWSISTTWNNTINAGDNEYDTLSYRIFDLNKIGFNVATTSFDYTTTEILPNWYRYTATDPGFEQNAAGQGWNIAFNEAGTIGYACIMGDLVGSDPLAPKPNIWKTTDGGATWNLLPDFDFGTLTEFQDWTIPTWDGQTIPYFVSADLTVDNDGKLNVFAEYISRSTSNTTADSLFYIWGGFTGLMHLTVSDGTDWTARLIAFSTLADATYGSGSNAFTVAYKPQISRTTDGGQIFFSWSNSDSTIVPDHSLPNLYVEGYDVASGLYTNEKNITAETDYDGTAFMPTISPVSMESAGTYELPVVFAQPKADSADVPQYYYVKGITFVDADFGAAPAAIANFTYTLGLSGSASFNNTSSNADSYSWDFGDGDTSPLTSPSHVYTSNGTYNVCLTAMNATSSDEACKNVTITNIVSVVDIALDNALQVYPSPSNGVITIAINSSNYSTATVAIYNMLGENINAPVTLNLTGNNTATLNLTNLSDGNYIVKVFTDSGMAVRQISIAR